MRGRRGSEKTGMIARLDLDVWRWGSLFLAWSMGIGIGMEKL